MECATVIERSIANLWIVPSDVCDATGWGRKDVRTVFASGMVAGLVSHFSLDAMK